MSTGYVGPVVTPLTSHRVYSGSPVFGLYNSPPLRSTGVPVSGEGGSLTPVFLTGSSYERPISQILPHPVRTGPEAKDGGVVRVPTSSS